MHLLQLEILLIRLQIQLLLDVVTIKGGAGDDILTGTASANDTIIGGAGVDTLVYIQVELIHLLVELEMIYLKLKLMVQKAFTFNYHRFNKR